MRPADVAYAKCEKMESIRRDCMCLWWSVELQHLVIPIKVSLYVNTGIVESVVAPNPKDGNRSVVFWWSVMYHEGQSVFEQQQATQWMKYGVSMTVTIDACIGWHRGNDRCLAACINSSLGSGDRHVTAAFCSFLVWLSRGCIIVCWVWPHAAAIKWWSQWSYAAEFIVKRSGD